MARNRPVRVEALMSRVLAHVAQQTGSGAALGQVWRQVVGPAVGNNAHPESLHAGVLTVRCDGVSWQQALEAQRAELLERLGLRLGAGVVKEIRFRSS